MPATVSLGDVLTIRWEFAAIGNVGYNITHWRVSMLETNPGGLPPAVAPLLSDIADPILAEMLDTFGDNWEPCASNQAALTGATIQSIHPAPRSRPFTHNLGAPRPGLNVGEALPLQDSPTLLKITPFGQRWGLGRMYVFGVPENFQALGVLNAGAIANLEQLAGSIDGPITMTIPGFNITLRPVLWHGVMRDGALFHDILGMRLSDNIIKTQRRRRPGKGI